MTSLPEVLLAAPVVDIDGTIFIQGAIFLALMFALDGLLFRPWLEVQARRHERIDGAFEHAAALEAKAAELDDRFQEQLAAVRNEAMELRSEARKKNEAEAGELVSAARAEGSRTLEAETARHAEAASRARADLEARIGELAQEIASRVLGRAA